MHESEMLINRALDGELSSAQRQSLEKWLLESEDHRREYLLRALEHLQLHQRVRDDEYQRVVSAAIPTLEQSQNVLQELMALEQLSGEPVPVDITESLEKQKAAKHQKRQKLGSLSTGPAKTNRKMVVTIPRWLVMTGSIAAAVVILAGLAVVFNVGRSSSPSTSSPDTAMRDTEPAGAYLLSSSDAVWANGKPDFELKAGQRLRLESGKATLRFRSSAQATLHAGTQLEVIGENRCRLTRGKLTSTVPAQASGFQVEVPGGLVTDLGTAFSIAISEEGQSRIQVQLGSVTIQPNTSSGDLAEPILLTAGMRGLIDPQRLTASLIKTEPIELASTGFDLAPGDEDPNWIIGAISTDPDYEPKPAVVAAQLAPNGKPIAGWQVSDANSKWLLIPEQGFDVTDEQRTTFQYRFELPEGIRLQDQSLTLKAWVDNHIVQVRVNGQVLYNNGDPALEGFSYNRPKTLVIDQHFVQGINQIEIMIANGTGIEKLFNPSAFRAEWIDTVVERSQQPLDQK